MSQPKPTPDPPTVTAHHSEHYRDSYANSVQVRMSVWDFFLVFGTMHQESPEEVKIENFQGIYLSPQQAKALFNVLGHNLAQYEQTFGTISLDQQQHPPVPLPVPTGPVH
jgi:flagellar protein FlaG